MESIEKTLTDPIEKPFRGFQPAANRFFEELALNQNREWFVEHKADHEQFVKEPMAALLQALTTRLASTALPLCGDAKRSLFRINRDVRFSADKSPYKTNASCILSRDGSKTSPGLVYFQFGDSEIFAAAGFYMPLPDDLQRLRKGMVRDPQGWLSIGKKLSKKGLSLMNEGSLKRLPKGYESAPEAIHGDLRLKSWAVSQSIPLKVARSEELIEVIAKFALSCADLLEFGWTALEQIGRPAALRESRH
jgi:uncharacterized protein (TIGR02453 family)